MNIFIASKKGQLNKVIESITEGAKPDDLDRYHSSILHCAAENKNVTPQFIEALIDLGAPVNQEDMYSTTALHYAAGESDDPEVIQVFLDKGSKINAPETFNRTPLHFASEKNENPAVINKLLENGANLHAVDNDGNTPLHDVRENKNVNVAITLIKNGANLDAPNKLGQTPKDFDVVKNALAIINLAEHQKAGEELQNILTGSEEYDTKINALEIVMNNYYNIPTHRQNIDSDKNKEGLSELAIPVNQGKRTKNPNISLSPRNNEKKKSVKINLTS